MSKKDLTKVWQMLTKYLVLYTLATWGVTQGLAEFFPEIPVAKTVYVAALYGFLICTPLYGICLWLARQYAGAYGSTTWHSRLPQVGLEDELDFAQPVSRMYQRLVLFFNVLLPLFAITHFYRKILAAPLIDNGSKLHIDLWSLPPASSLVEDAYRFGENGAVTFFPFYQPLCLTLMLFAIWLYFILFILMLFRGYQNRKKPLV